MTLTDPEEIQKLEEVHKQDEIDEEEYKQFVEKASEGGFGKLWVYNEPRYLIYLGFFFSLITGAAQPLFGVIFSKIMNLLLEPITPENR